MSVVPAPAQLLGFEQQGTALVRVEAVAVNPIDLKVHGRRPASAESPVILGFDAAGVVESVGAAVARFGVGDPVFYAGSVARSGCRSTGENARGETGPEPASAPSPSRDAYGESFSDAEPDDMPPLVERPMGRLYGCSSAGHELRLLRASPGRAAAA